MKAAIQALFFGAKGVGNQNGNKPAFVSIPASDMFPTGDGQPFHETEKAYGFSFTKREGIVWIPKSQVKDFAKNFDNYSIEFWIPEWLIKAKEIEKYKSTANEPTLF